MSEILFAEKDPAVVEAEVLARYEAITGVALQPADPRRLHLNSFLYWLDHTRALIDYSGKQNLLRYVDKGKPIEEAIFLIALAAWWGEEPIAAAPSTCTLQFAGGSLGSAVLGKRATDGTNVWTATEVLSTGGSFTDALGTCTVAGASTNGIAIGQIDTLVDSFPGCTGVENTTETTGGRNTETTEELRERLRTVPEATSTCGPRLAYEAIALAASGSVVGAKALGPQDAGEMAGTPPDPGQVFVLVIEGEKDASGNVTAVEPEPSGDLLDAVEAACSADEVRPLTDEVIVKAPEFVDYDVTATYYIARSRQAFETEIRDAVEAAADAYVLWQDSKIGRDVNPSRLNADIVIAGAKRAAITLPAFAALAPDECATNRYFTLTYGGVEDD